MGIYTFLLGMLNMNFRKLSNTSALPKIPPPKIAPLTRYHQPGRSAIQTTLLMFAFHSQDIFKRAHSLASSGRGGTVVLLINC